MPKHPTDHARLNRVAEARQQRKAREPGYRERAPFPDLRSPLNKKPD